MAKYFFSATEWKLQLRNVKPENVMKLLGNGQISVQVSPDQGSSYGGWAELSFACRAPEDHTSTWVRQFLQGCHSLPEYGSRD